MSGASWPTAEQLRAFRQRTTSANIPDPDASWVCHEFRFGDRIVKASKARSLACNHQVYLLKLDRPTDFDLDLPASVIIKKMKSDDDENPPDPDDTRTPEEKLDHEKQAYERLKSVQGTFVPQCFGEAQYDGQRALVLSVIDGVDLTATTEWFWEGERNITKEKIAEPFRALAACGVVHGDADLINLMFVDLGHGDYRIMILDFEYAEFVDTAVDWEQSQSCKDANDCYVDYEYWRDQSSKRWKYMNRSQAEKDAETKQQKEWARLAALRVAQAYNFPIPPELLTPDSSAVDAK